MSLIKNTGWNILGTGVSALAMVPAMAYIARQLDVESFGLLTLVFSFVGYATVLDGGVARAVIREVALNRSDKAKAARIVGTGFWLVIVFGVLSALLMVLLSDHLVTWLKVTGTLEDSASSVFAMSGLIVLPLLLTALWVAPVEGMGHFKELNLIRGLGYVVIFGSVSLAVWVQPTLFAAVCGLLLGRLVMAGMACLAGCRTLGTLPLHFDRPALVRLYRFGGWLTVSNIVSPAIEYLDRFVLSAVAGASRVAYYTGPAEMLAKLSSIPHAVSRALFPQLSAQNAHKTPGFQDIALPMGIQGVIGLGVVLGALLFGDEIMGLWLGSGYAETAGPILKILAIGYLCNSLNLIPYTALQAAGHAKLTAAVYLEEFLPYLLLLFLMVHSFGLYGAAFAWVAKTVFELVAFVWLYKSNMLRAPAA